MTIKFVNKGKYILTCILGLFFSSAFSQQIISESIQTSIINLISSPEKYDNKRIIIKGFLSLEKENYCIYLTKDDLTYRNTKNSIFLLLSYDIINTLYKQNLNGAYIEVLGQYVIPKIETSQKIYKIYGGVLNNIEDIHKVEVY
ncbi:hypothetical protein [Chryseobacterium sp. Mn2064]|uniref:hypothetical protein n=1 Tax=Chryseobacterium sp. Mn2064 TaxID=3395263 RepID=UPI003BEA24BA